MYKKYIKRIIDLILCIVLLLITAPLFLIIILVLLIFNKREVFFVQKRPGKNGNIFKMIKFKTMKDGNSDDFNRITKIGKILRVTSMDELPQLLNILKGDMSFIGPRPLRVEYLELYSKEQARRHLVLPGVTGWAQVNGRNTIAWEKKFEYDVWYVDNLSISLDVKIFFLTLKKVIFREGVNKNDNITMEPFKGENK